MSKNRECPDQTARMRTLIWTFAVHIWHNGLFLTLRIDHMFSWRYKKHTSPFRLKKSLIWSYDRVMFFTDINNAQNTRMLLVIARLRTGNALFLNAKNFTYDVLVLPKENLSYNRHEQDRKAVHTPNVLSPKNLIFDR